MQENLDRLKAEIEEYLHANSFIVFHGQSRVYDEAQIVYWDTAKYPNYLDFLKTAESAGVRFLVMHTEIFDEATIEDLENGLEGIELPRDERRAFDKRIQEFGAYAGMVCEIELSYVFDNQVYLYSTRALWYHDYEDLYEELMLSGTGFDDDETPGDEPMGGFFSKN
jgi:hypothetical protein